MTWREILWQFGRFPEIGWCHRLILGSWRFLSWLSYHALKSVFSQFCHTIRIFTHHLQTDVVTLSNWVLPYGLYSQNAHGLKCLLGPACHFWANGRRLSFYSSVKGCLKMIIFILFFCVIFFGDSLLERAFVFKNFFEGPVYYKTFS